MEFIDVEGKGGTANREALRQEVYTRSPHTRIDKAVLDFKVYYTENITYRLSFNFNDNKGYADKKYLKSAGYATMSLVIEVVSSTTNVLRLSLDS